MDTTVIVTADHGENLCYPSEDGLFGHKSSLSEALLHVPLLVINPPNGETGHNEEYVSHLNLGEFIRQIARGTISDPTNKSIAAELIGMGFDTWELDPEDHQWWDRLQRCAYQNDTKVHWDSLGNANEYEINKNHPCKQNEKEEGNCIPSWASEHFEMKLDDYEQQLGDTDNIDDSQLDASTEERLHDLGYL